MKPEILIPISFFLMIYGIVYIAIRRKERLALIAKGADASLFQSKKHVPSELKWGMLLLGVGTGLLFGRIFAAYSCLGEEASYFSMICLFGGLSLVIYHFLARAMEKKSDTGV